jgi:integrase
MPLTDPACKNVKPKDKPFKIADEKGMYLLVNPNGSKYFRLKYRFGGKEKTLALGVYPETSLKQAREKRDAAKKQIADGIDPGLDRKIKKTGATENSFQAVALEWYEKNMLTKSESHRTRTLRQLERDIFPWIGGRPIVDIKAPELLAVLRRIESRNAIETAHRALQTSGQVFRYAIATGRCERDISSDLRGALTSVNGSNFASMTDPKQVAPLLRAIDDYSGTFIVKCALQLAPLVFVRPGELRQAEWAHIDLDAKEWRYLVTKTQTPHIVPLSKQAVEILISLRPLTSSGRFVFPSARTPNGSRPMSDVALLAALRRMGFDKTEMSVHGFRAMARTLLDELLGFRPDFIEHQLAHAVKDPNGRAYNRTAHLPERRKMMQAWADYLDGLKAGADVISLGKRA